MFTPDRNCAPGHTGHAPHTETVQGLSSGSFSMVFYSCKRVGGGFWAVSGFAGLESRALSWTLTLAQAVLVG